MSDHRTAEFIDVVRVLQSYSNALDRGDIDGILKLFTPDAVWDYSKDEQRQGHEQIRAFFAERLTVFAKTHHLVGPPIIDHLASGEMESTAYFTATHHLSDDSRYVVNGRYVDLLVRRDDRILIARRKLVAHVTLGTHRDYNFLERTTTPADFTR